VVRITADFQQERVLHPAAISLLSEFFTNGWADPNKLNNTSRQAAILLQQVRQTFATALNARPDEIEFLGEVDLGFQLGITGLLKAESKLYYSKIDRQKIFAVATTEQNLGRSTTCLPVDGNGEIADFTCGPQDVICWQVANGESGNLQKVIKKQALIFADCTASGVDHLPEFEYQTALFDSASWQGPAGLGVLVIKSAEKWRNPLPHNDLARTPGTFSIPLALASAVALENYLKEIDIRSQLKQQIIAFIKSEIADVDIASSAEGLAKFVSFSIKGIEADRALLALEELGFAVDSGSACKSADMQPSHVLAAMGRPIAGNLRLTIHKDISEKMVKEFCQALKITVAKLRRN